MVLEVLLSNKAWINLHCSERYSRQYCFSSPFEENTCLAITYCLIYLNTPHLDRKTQRRIQHIVITKSTAQFLIPTIPCLGRIPQCSDYGCFLRVGVRYRSQSALGLVLLSVGTAISHVFDTVSGHKTPTKALRHWGMLCFPQPLIIFGPDPLPVLQWNGSGMPFLWYKRGRERERAEEEVFLL